MLEMPGVGCPYYLRKLCKCFIGKPKVHDERIETALVAAMREAHIRNIVWNCLTARSGAQDLIRWYVQELRARIDEAVNKPGARDAIDLWTLARDPARRGAPTSWFAWMITSKPCPCMRPHLCPRGRRCRWWLTLSCRTRASRSARQRAWILRVPLLQCRRLSVRGCDADHSES